MAKWPWSRYEGEAGDAVLPRLTYRPELDAIRGVAIALVVLQHFIFDKFGGIPVPGPLGVTLFFVLSGYLITSLLIAERSSTGGIELGRFYIRRIRRLLPALIVLIAVVAIICFPGNSLIALAYVTNWAVRFGIDMGALSHTWTLGIEEQFYLVWPIAFIVLSRWPRVLVAVLLAVILVSIVFRDQIGEVMHADALGAGAILAVSRRHLPRWLGIAGWLSIGALVSMTGYVPPWGWTVAAAGSLLIVGSGLVPTWRPLVWLGTISYGVYLWHYPVERLIGPIAARGSPVQALLVLITGIFISIGLAVISERWVERRFRVRRRTAAGEPIVDTAGAPIAPVAA